MKYRSHGEGTLYQRKNGLWTAQLTLPDGKRITKYGKTQKEVRDWLLLKRRELSQGILVDDERMTVSAFLDRWYETVKPRLRTSTQTVHEVMIRNHIKPEIGFIRLSHLTPVHLQDLYSKKLKQGLSNRSVRYIHTILHQMLDQAIKWGLLSKNVSEAVDAPIPSKKPVEPITPPQVQRFFDAARDDRLYPLWVTAVGMGLRRGELLALTWDCIDWDRGVVRIKKTIQSVKGKGLVLGEPKSASSRRTVAMPEFVQKTLADSLVSRTTVSDYVFCTSKGTPFLPRNLVRYFKRTLKKAGLPETIRIHDLRHFWVSYLLSQNVPPKDVQVMAGHADFSTTMDIYGHLMPGAQKEAAKKMDGLFNS